MHLLEQVNDISEEMACELEAMCKAANEQRAALEVEIEELKAQLQTQKTISGLGQLFFWQYEIDGGWEEFTPLREIRRCSKRT